MNTPASQAVTPLSPHSPGPLLAQRTAVVTGGAAGIGRAISLAFALHGADVLVVDSDESALESLVVDVARSGTPPVRTLLLDVTHPDAAERIAGSGDSDILVNNVGHFVFPPTVFGASTAAEWSSLEAVNLGHVLSTTRAVLPGMIDRGRGGSIINLTTVEAFRGIPGYAVYSAYKSAVTQFGKSLAVEVGQYGIRVNSIAPDVIDTPQLPYSEWVAEEDRWRWRTWTPLGRPGSAHDAAGVALFLASSLSAFVTGSTVHVDGGTLAAGGWYPRNAGGWTNRPVNP